MKNAKTWIVLMLTMALSIAPVAKASVIVFDPTNFAVNLEQVAHHLELIARLEAQIRNQLRMLENWKFTRLGELMTSMQQIQSTVAGVADLDLGGQYAIAASAYSARDEQAMSELRRDWLESQRAAILVGRTAQESVVADMPVTQRRINEYVQEARHAPGQTAVAQATNETIASLAGQLQSLQALELAEVRVELEEEAQRQAEAAFRSQRREALMRDWTADSSGSVAFAGSAPVRQPFVSR